MEHGDFVVFLPMLRVCLQLPSIHHLHLTCVHIQHRWRTTTGHHQRERSEIIITIDTQALSASVPVSHVCVVVPG